MEKPTESVFSSGSFEATLMGRLTRLGCWQAGQGGLDAFQRLYMAAQRAGADRVETLAALVPVAAQLLGLLQPQGAELVVVIGAK